MAEDQQQTSQTENQAPAEGQQAEGSGSSSPEDIEAYWRNRQSQSDRAHAAEAKALREQLAAAQQQNDLLKQGQTDAAAAQTAREQELQNQLKQQIAQNQQIQAQGVLEARTAKYPEAVASLGDPNVVVTIDEGRLASLQEKLTPAAPPPPPTKQPLMADAGAPRPQGAGPKDVSQMSKEELRLALKDAGPEWVERMKAEGRM